MKTLAQNALKERNRDENDGRQECVEEDTK